MQQKIISKAFVTACLLTGWISMHAQLFKPLGLGVDNCEHIGNYTRQQMHVEGDTLYVCTKHGIYSKDLSKEESSWQIAGFRDIPVQDYVRSGNDMLALIRKTDGKYMLLSHDGGKTYEDITPDTFREEQFIRLLSQHPADPDTLLVSGSMGLFQSCDFGQTWEKLSDFNYPSDMGYHPFNPVIIYFSGCDCIWQPYICISYDEGQTWKYNELYAGGDNCFGITAFNPTDPDVWISGGQLGNIFITTDNGNTWDVPFLNKSKSELFNALWDFAFYDNVNSDIVYMAGPSYNECVVMCSVDGGKNWNIPQNFAMNSDDPDLIMYDFRQSDDRLLIYTTSDVYMVSKKELIAQSTPVRAVTVKTSGDSHYGIDGRPTAPDSPGLHIIRSDDGRVEKVLVK